MKKLNNIERETTITVFGKTIFVLYIAKHRGWLRFFNKGLRWKNILYEPMIFSERNGYVRYILIGPWLIKNLKHNG